MAESHQVQEALAHARAWVEQLGPAWIARFDQMAADVREWALAVNVDPKSYEFRAAWCVATTFIHRMAKTAELAGKGEGDEIHRLGDILATVGLLETPGS